MTEEKETIGPKVILMFSIFIISLVLFSFSVEAIELNNQVLKDYRIDVEVAETVQVEQSFKVASTSQKPIVPGYAKLVLFEDADPQNIVVNIGGSVKRLDDYELVDGKPVIYYDIWRPLSKGEELEVKVSFVLEDFVSSGILFQEINFGVGKLAIPVESSKLFLKFPKDKYVSYTKPDYINKYVDGNTRIYEYDLIPGKKLNAEYSSIPLPTLPFNGYWLWLGFALLSLTYFVMQVIGVMREIKTHNNKADS